MTLAGVVMLLQSVVQAAAGFVDVDEIKAVGIEQLMSEISLIDTIGKGILLAISQCETDEVCLGHVDRAEVQQMIEAIDDRVQLLGERREETGEPGLEDVLIAYVEQRENLTNYLERIDVIVPDDAEEDVGNDFFGITTTSVSSIAERYRIFNDVDEALEDEVFQPDDEAAEAAQVPQDNVPE